MTFREWIDSQTLLPNGSLGDFIEDVQGDMDFPADVSSWEKLESYLLVVANRNGIFEDAKKVWKNYQLDLKKRKIKKSKLFNESIFKRQYHQAKNKGIPVFKSKKLDNQLQFDCPYCMKTHLHGAEGGRLEPYKLTHRVAHCFSNSPLGKTGYFIYYT